MLDPEDEVFYLVRHCEAMGQAPDAPLTEEGVRQAETLADILADTNVERIVASPFLRARQSVLPLSERIGVEIEEDSRLAERVLCATPMPDWKERLRDTFSDPDLRFEGGESSREATNRGVEAVEGALADGILPVAFVSHGNLTALILRHFDSRFGFEEWQSLSNPDVFRVATSAGEARIARLPHAP